MQTIPAQKKSVILKAFLINYMPEVKQMNMLKQLNAAIEYIESNLCAEFDLDTAAGIACVTADSFIRFFSYMTGMTLTEYVRRRRLSLISLWNMGMTVRRLFQEPLRNNTVLHRQFIAKMAVPLKYIKPIWNVRLSLAWSEAHFSNVPSANFISRRRLHFS